jgi:hypothetical protein
MCVRVTKFLVFALLCSYNLFIWTAFTALNAVPIRPNIRPIWLFGILDAEVGNAFAKKLRFSLKHLIDEADLFVTKKFWFVINLACPADFFESAH